MRREIPAHLRVIEGGAGQEPQVEVVVTEEVKGASQAGLQAELDGHFSAAVLAKGKMLLRQGRVTRDEDHTDILWVASPNATNERGYRIQIGRDGSFVTCTCAHGLHVGGGRATCSHVAAVLMWALSQLDTFKEG